MDAQNLLMLNAPSAFPVSQLKAAVPDPTKFRGRRRSAMTKYKAGSTPSGPLHR